MNVMTFTAPNRIKGLPDSMIRAMTIEAHKYNAINMGQGMPEFAPPPSVIEAAKLSLSDKIKNQYTEDRGLSELREKVSAKYKRFYNLNVDPEKEITIVCGVTEAIVAVLLATVEQGDKVVIPEPAHENYLAATLFAGGSPVWIPLVAPEFSLDLNLVEKAFKKGAKHFLLNTPHNPTGRVFTSEELEGLSSLCDKYDVSVITDDIYEHIIYDGKIFRPFALLPGMRGRTITTSGIGKTYSLTGWRVGYVIAPEEKTHLIRRAHTYLSICAPTPFQHAAVTLLDLPDAYYKELISKYSASRKLMMEILNKTGFKAIPPEGAYYVMADFSEISDDDDITFSLRLVKEKKVAVIPGSSFYSDSQFGKKLVRFAFPKPLNVLAEVLKRLSQNWLHATR